MDNEQIADRFSLLAKLMDIHGENSFKAKSYAAAAFAIDRLPVQLRDTAPEKISGIKGIGDSTGKKVIELLQTGELEALNLMIAKTPEGILEMMRIKGIGPKKIATIWKEMEIETIGELLYACQENRLKLYKGFGEKTQASVAETIEYYLNNKGSFLYAQMEIIAETVEELFKRLFPSNRFEFAGAFKRKVETIDELDIVIDIPLADAKKKLVETGQFSVVQNSNDSALFKTAEGLQIRIHSTPSDKFLQTVFQKTCAENFLQALPAIDFNNCECEENIFEKASLHFIPPYLRETSEVIDRAKSFHFKDIIQPSDIKGIIHCHSDWSDGSNSLEEMARAAREKGFEYLVISDHSKSAFYASGLSEERIFAQHQYIDELNSKLAPFKIFKSIESDILNDGSLDYSDAVLASFDLVIASVHSNLKMTQEKAMSRLLAAIRNPYTTILGHMTGRLLLSRKGYPVDHKVIIDACAEHKVVIELNAHPNRLDIDWRQVAYALEKNVLISIDPDAHSIEGFNDIKYGTYVAQKAMLTKERNLSSFGLTEFETYLAMKKRERIT